MENSQPATELALTSRQERAIAARDAIATGGRPAPLVPRTFIEAQALCGALASSDLIPRALKDRAADVLVIVLAGVELGLAPMQALRMHHVIEGIPRLSSDGLAAIVMASPECDYLECTESSDQRCTWVSKRRGRPHERSVTWTIERAKRAGLVDRKNRDGSPGMWTRYPENMLSARARAELCRMMYADVVGGLITREEAIDGAIDAEFTEIREAPRTPAPAPAPAPRAAYVPPAAPLVIGSPQPIKRGPGRPPKVRPEPVAVAAIPEPPPPPPPLMAEPDPIMETITGPDPMAPEFEAPPAADEPEGPPMFGDPAPEPLAGIAEFDAWLSSCRTPAQLEEGRDKWVRFSKEHYQPGSAEPVAMQRKYAQRMAALRAGAPR